jgi:tricorn protease-like protein
MSDSKTISCGRLGSCDSHAFYMMSVAFKSSINARVVAYTYPQNWITREKKLFEMIKRQE